MQLNPRQARDFAIFASGNALTSARHRVKLARRALTYANATPRDDEKLAAALAALAEADASYARAKATLTRAP